MEKFITIFAPAYSTPGNWGTHPGKLKQFFTGLTGYDIMLEKSRMDLVPGINPAVPVKPGQVMSASLSGSIARCLVLFGRESCNNNK